MGMFKNTLLLAQQGNEKAMEKLLNRYDPLLKKCSICTIYLCGALHSFYTIFSFIIAKFDSFWGLIVKIIKIFLIFLHDLAFNCDDIYRGTKKTLSP